MEQPLRIAVAGRIGAAVEAMLRQLPSQPDVHAFAAVGSDEELLAFRPDLLLLGDETLQPAAVEAPALTLLGRLRERLPETGVVCVVPIGREYELRPLVTALGATLLLLPSAPGGVAAAVEHARSGAARPREDAFVDVARGFADEINNPLLYVSGYLQLLSSTFDAHRDRDRQDQLQAALRGVQRIHASVERIGQIATAAMGIRAHAAVDLAALLHRLLDEPAAKLAMPPRLRLSPETGTFVVRGDAELLLAALRAIVQLAIDLGQLEQPVELELQQLAATIRLRLLIAGPGPIEWRLPRTFEPYYLSRVLAGTSHGLGMFLAQAVILAHAGQALAQRLPDGTFAVDLLLPAPSPPRP